MKEGIHPNYGKCIVRCACGETFETGSVEKEIRVDICSKCHPFYTGRRSWWIPVVAWIVSRSATACRTFTAKISERVPSFCFLMRFFFSCIGSD